MKRTWYVTPLIAILTVILAIQAVITAFFSIKLFIAQAAAVLIITVFVLLRIRKMNITLHKHLKRIIQTFSSSQREALANFAIPILLTNQKGEIIWYNKTFEDSILQGKTLTGKNISSLLPHTDLENHAATHPINISVGNRHYSVYINKTTDDQKKAFSLFFIDDTRLKQIAREFELSRSVVMLINIDNFEEMIQNTKESEQAQISGEVQSILENFFADTYGFLKTLSRDKFLAIIQERDLTKIIQGNFEVLNRVHKVTNGRNMNCTLSIGVGRGKNLHQSERYAKVALDMALSRGGDQAAIKDEKGFEFYGGALRGATKNTRVRSRIIASALSELISQSSNVLIMGHIISDLDSLGAAAGILAAAKALTKSANIVLDTTKTLAAPLIDKFNSPEYTHVLSPPEKATDFVQDDTLLVIVDTHRFDMLESQSLYRAVKQVAVIDHHRKTVDHIDNAVLFYHEPYASSTCEMVTEILQYIEGAQPTPFEAEALLAGITLDTRNFVIRTGVRTFEAAAWLRKLGADTIKVKQLFSNTMDVYKKKSKLVSQAEIIGSFAISSSREKGTNIRLAAAQAADELLSIEGVLSSYVLYMDKNIVNISARSLGSVNVQLVMEQLGGGGHFTMAGAQLENVTIEEAKEKLLKAISSTHP